MSVSGRVGMVSGVERDGVGGEGEESVETAHPAPSPQQQQHQGNGRFKSEISLTASVITVITAAR